MSDKSHVGLGFYVCPICLDHHTESVLINRRLRPTLEREQAIGWELCPTHEKMREEYIALVEVEKEGTWTVANAPRTHNVAHIRRSIWEGVFPGTPEPKVMAWVPIGVVQGLQSRMPVEDQSHLVRTNNEDSNGQEASASGEGAGQEDTPAQEGSAGDAQGPREGEGASGDQGDAPSGDQPEARRDD